jgi:hypothetical protein
MRLPEGIQIWQVTKFMSALERSIDLFKNCTALKQAKLVTNPCLFPTMAMVNAGTLATPINEFVLLNEEESACDEVEVDGNLRIC